MPKAQKSKRAKAQKSKSAKAQKRKRAKEQKLTLRKRIESINYQKEQERFLFEPRYWIIPNFPLTIHC
jgi:hypothetical protein